MRTSVIIILVIQFTTQGFAEYRDYGMSKDLGNGFVLKHYTVENPPHIFESIAHYSATFYKGRDLGMLDGFSVSPNGKYAIYTKSRDGRLYMFDLTSEAEKKIKFKKYCYPTEHKWREKENKIKIYCLGEKDYRFSLLIDLTNQTGIIIKKQIPDE